jgi:4-aminobutyrate aminotransferase-like enzyme
LRVIRDEKLQDNALHTGEYLINGLTEQLNPFPLVGDVRGSGLYIGIELVNDPNTLTPAKNEAHTIAEKMKEAGILISVDGPLHNVLKFKPPIQFNKQNADRYVETITGIIKELS